MLKVIKNFRELITRRYFFAAKAHYEIYSAYSNKSEMDMLDKLLVLGPYIRKENYWYALYKILGGPIMFNKLMRSYKEGLKL